MIDMALLSVIRRWHFREGMPIRESERRTGLSRNTIRKYLRADTVDPKFRVPVRPSKLDAFAQKLSDWLRVEACKSRKPGHVFADAAIRPVCCEALEGLGDRARIERRGTCLELQALDQIGFRGRQYGVHGLIRPGRVVGGNLVG